MKEATGEVSMTVVTLVAIGVIGAILAMMWPTIQNSIEGLWGNVDSSQDEINKAKSRSKFNND